MYVQVSARNGTDISVGDVPAELVGGWSSSAIASFRVKLVVSCNAVCRL